MKNRTFQLALLFLVIWCSVVAASAQQADSPGSQDHPLISRYEGSFIDGYEVHDFDQYTLPTGPAVRDEAGGRIPSAKKILEGKITRILYRGPDGRSTLEIIRNYRTALEAAGFNTLFVCGGDDCGRLFQWLFYKDMEQRIRTTKTSSSAFDIPQDLRYLASEGVVDGATVHVSVLVAFDAGFSDLSKRPVTLLEVIESEAMDTGMVTVDAEAIGKGLDASGHMAIYGILFDTDSAEIKPESKDTLQEIAKLLQERPSLELLVVGHTDNQGDYDYNMGLSARRAEAVTKTLADNYGVEAGRLRSAGVGYLCPVASNDSDAGRKMNRRVELVKK